MGGMSVNLVQLIIILRHSGLNHSLQAISIQTLGEKIEDFCNKSRVVLVQKKRHPFNETTVNILKIPVHEQEVFRAWKYLVDSG